MAEFNEKTWRELGADEVEEIMIDKTLEETASTTGEDLFCNLCMKINPNLAAYRCYKCDVLLCDDCSKVHTHTCVRLQSERKERKTKGESLLVEMRREEVIPRETEREIFKKYGRFNVKHALDIKDCWIEGFCGLLDDRWVVVDRYNYCMKIFSAVTNTVLKYVRFGLRPQDVTQIDQISTDLNSASGSKFGVSGTALDEKDKHCLLAVTFARTKQIRLIDLTETPAMYIKKIQMKKHCYEICSSEDKIFTRCKEDVGSRYRYTIDILSTDGNTLKVIPLDFNPNDLSVYENKIYLTDLHSNTVFCINSEDGNTISQLHIEGAGLRGICVDYRNNVYVCGREHNTIYKLPPDLHGLEPLSRETDFTEKPLRICCTKNNLVINHSSSSLRNFVTVIQLT